MKRRWLWFIFLISLSAPFWRLGTPLIEVDDARYAEVPREMLVLHDWVTPHLDAMDYVEKPPLWYWLAAASYEIFGVSEASARLPLALLALLGLLLTYWLGSWLFSPKTGMTAAILLSASALYFFLAHYMTLDMALSVFLLGSSAMILRALLRPEDARWAAPAAWVFAGLAFLSKGLIALVFPAGWVFFMALLYPETWRKMLVFFRPLGIALFLLIVAPWFVYMEARHPGFFHFFFVDEHFKRFLTMRYERDQPWFFFLWVIPATLVPVTPAVLAAVPKSWRVWKAKPKEAALWIWVGMIVVFFSISHSKLATYALPVYPYLALLGAAALEERPAPSWTKRFSAALGALLWLALAASFFIPAARGFEAPFSLLARGLADAAIAVIGASLIAYGAGLPAVLSLGAGGLLAWALALGTMNAASSFLSVKDVSAAIVRDYKPGDRIDVYDTYFHGLPFYTGHWVDRIFNWTGELAYAKKNPADAGRFGSVEEISRYPLAGRRVFLVLKKTQISYVRSLVKPGRASFKSFGPYELVEFPGKGR
ncbi:MAG TPA: glycosyltransferase family 39 protein [Elusimicrobiota bacterium]|nr:glycosyltransferase family 39 protein [Elusimicrobiota bacterium]